MEKIAQPARGCPQCSGRSYLIERQGDFASARICDCLRGCKVCGGAGYVRTTQEATFSVKVGPRAYDVLAPCHCRLLQKRVVLFNAARIPGVLAHADFAGYQPQGMPQDHAKQVATAFALGYQRGKSNKGFILSGPVGAGKTHLMVAALSHLILEVGVQAQYVEISLLYADIRRGFHEGKSGGEIIKPHSEVEVLVIDELGKGRGSPFEMETLDELVARRYNAGRTTLFATNYSLEYEKKAARPSNGYRSPGEEAKNTPKEPELLRERVGERIYSRLCEMCEFVEMPRGPRETPDHRHMQHEKERPPRAAQGRQRTTG